MSADLPPPPEIDPPSWTPPELPRSSRTRVVLSRTAMLVFNLLAFVVFFGLSITFAASGMRLVGLGTPSGLNMAILSGGVLVSLAGFSVVWPLLLGRPVDAAFAWPRSPAYRVRNLVALGMVFAPVAAFATTMLSVEDKTSPIEKLLSEAFGPVVFIAIAIAPLAEETIFRGFLFRVFSDAAGGWVGLLATSLIFAELHASQLGNNWAGVGVILVVGSVLGFLRLRSGSILPGVLVHLAYNGTLFVLELLTDWVASRFFP